MSSGGRNGRSPYTRGSGCWRAAAFSRAGGRFNMPRFYFRTPVGGKTGLKRRRAAYALPTLFTAGNIYLAFLAILRTFEASMAAKAGSLGSNADFPVAAKAIGLAVVLDGLDGRIARMTHTVSEFGREMDSLADVITFGIAPAVLAHPPGGAFFSPRRASPAP